MKLSNIKLQHFLFALVILLFSLVSVTYAWTDNTYTYPQGILGKSRLTYFAGGDGTSSDPYIIRKASHFFNLSYLQNLGLFDNTTYYFKIDADDPETTGVVEDTIDFSQAVELYQSIKPIGTVDYPFYGYLDGNNQTLLNLTVDSNGLQDIGIFGYVGAISELTPAYIHDLFIDSLTINSNPLSTDDDSGFHMHNDGNINIVTGDIVGHIVDYSSLNNIFVVSPTINSMSSEYANRTQYGLIGYSTADLGVIAGGPEDSEYSFNLNAGDGYAAFEHAAITYGNYYVNGTSVILSDVLDYTPNVTSGLLDMLEGYSLSTLKISATQAGEQIFLYDQLVIDGHEIGSELIGYYNKRNVDLVGLTTFGMDPSTQTLQFIVSDSLETVITPSAGQTFVVTDIVESVVLYVKPSSDPNDLGQITVNFSGAQGLSLYSGNAGSTPTQINFGVSGSTHTLLESEAFSAVTLDDSTGVLTVVDTDPDYYVYVLGGTVGNTKIQDIAFIYTPAELNTDSLSSVANVDYIQASEIDGIKSNIINGVDPAYNYSYINFGYEINNSQGILISVEKTGSVGSYVYEITFDYTFADTTFITINIINLLNMDIVIMNNHTTIPAQEYSGSHDLIEVIINYDDIISVTGTAVG